MKDNKIDIMCNKIGSMITVINTIHDDSDVMSGIVEALRQLQYDLELLRKCTLDNPDFKWDDNTTHGYTQAKSEAFRND